MHENDDMREKRSVFGPLVVLVVALVTGGWFLQRGVAQEANVYLQARLFQEVLEHVTELEASCDELVRVTRPDGLLYLSVPRAAAFDDGLYRFAGYFAKYALMKFKKRIEHQQRFDF